jgi:outer membrane protein assembly factor BamB
VIGHLRTRMVAVAGAATLVVAGVGIAVARSDDGADDPTTACAAVPVALAPADAVPGEAPTPEIEAGLVNLSAAPGFGDVAWVAGDGSRDLVHVGDVYVSGIAPDDDSDPDDSRGVDVGEVTITARAEADGAVRWATTIPGPFELRAVGGHGELVGVLVEGDDGHPELHVLAAADGAEVACAGIDAVLNGWRFDATTGTYLLGTFDDWIAVPIDGAAPGAPLEVAWRGGTEGRDIVVGGGLAVDVVRDDGVLAISALDQADGAELWTIPITRADGEPTITGRDRVDVVVGDGVVVVVVEPLPDQTVLVALDAATGQERWRRYEQARIGAAGVVGDTVLVGVSDTVPGLCESLICGAGLDASDGSVRWSDQGVIDSGLGAGVVPLVDDLVVTAGAFGSNVVDPATGIVGEIEGGFADYVAGAGTVGVSSAGIVLVLTTA